MKSTYKNRFRVLGISILLIIGIFSLQACKNEEKDMTVPGGSRLKVSLVNSSVESETITLKNGNKSSSSQNALPTAQVSSQKIDESNTIDISLTPITSKSIQKNTINGDISNKAALVQKVLEPGTKYDIIIYGNDGKFVAKKTYSYGEEASDLGIQLDAGKTYTVIATSINSKTTTQAIIDQQLLSTATLANVNSQLMYFKKVIKMNEGDNQMDVILKHQFSEITTKLHMDENKTGNITEIKNPFFQLSHSSANLNIGSGAVSYNGLPTVGQAATYPNLGAGVRSITSAPTLLIHPSTTTEILKFERLEVDGEVKNNVLVDKLKLTPGHRYDLDILFKTCTQDVTGAEGLNWDYAEVSEFGILGGRKGIKVNGTFRANGYILERSITAPAADYGFVFDIEKLDNTFNMEVNGTKLALKEIQFQNIDDNNKQTVKFADGSLYDGNNTQSSTKVPAVYDMTGTATKPLIKIVISRTGQVTMYGSKSSQGPLLPLVLVNNSFNSFPWNTTSANIVKITQRVEGRTTMKGYGSGKKKIKCS